MECAANERRGRVEGFETKVVLPVRITQNVNTCYISSAYTQQL